MNATTEGDEEVILACKDIIQRARGIEEIDALKPGWTPDADEQQVLRGFRSEQLLDYAWFSVSEAARRPDPDERYGMLHMVASATYELLRRLGTRSEQLLGVAN